ncbi:MAG: ABC transporter permease [Phycisphaerales bacterium]
MSGPIETSATSAAGSWWRVAAPLAGLAIVVLVFFAIPPHLGVTADQARTVAVHAVIVGVAALGATIVIAGAGLDLSVGSVIALAGVVAAILLRDGHALWIAIAAAIGVGLVCGAYNGLLVAGLRLPAFIATLGTLGFFRGVAKWISGSRAISAPTHGLETLATPRPPFAWMLVAPGVWILLALATATAFFVHRSVPGRHLLAVGGNEAAARRCGIPVGRVRFLSYALAGTLAGVAGLLQFARLRSGDPTVAIGLELDVIAAVVIGGASLSGGSASVLGTLAGAVMIAYLRNRCAVLGWPNHVQEMIVGHIVILAVAIDLWRRRRRK